MNTKNLGDVGELKVALELTKRGIPIYLSFGDNSKADMVAEFNGGLQKIQVKSSMSNDGEKVTFSIESSMRGYRYRYTKEDIDFFFLYDGVSDKVYVLPIEEAPSGGSVVLRLVPTRNGQVKGINFAKDYELEKFFN